MFSIPKIFGSEKHKFDYDALVETECSECYIRISAWKDDDDGYSAVWLTELTGHNNPEQISWRWRLQKIYRILRNYPNPSFEISSPKVLNNLITALREGGDTVFKQEVENN